MGDWQKHESELNGIVCEYLVHGGYSATSEIFDTECLSKGKPNKNASKIRTDQDNARVAHIQGEIMSAFENGDNEGFQKLWDSNIPLNVRESDPTCQKLHFYANIFFAVQPLLPAFAENLKSKTVEVTMAHFRTYLENKGAALSKTQEFLPYYALPFVPEPEAHPSFAPLFEDSWVPELKVRLEKFLSKAVASGSNPHLYYLAQKKKVAQNNGINEDYLETLQAQITESEEREMRYIDRHNRVQREYHHLVGVAAELVEALEKCINGQTITPGYLENLVSRLNDLTTTMADNNVADSVMFERKSMPKLDYEAIKKDLVLLDDQEASLLLQALRWRLTRSPLGIRARTMAEYIKHDILGIDQDSEILGLLKTTSSGKIECITRFYNCIASLAQGRAYLSQNTKVIHLMCDWLKKEESDTPTRQNVLGALQKLSLRRPAQTVMINLDMINWLVRVLQSFDSLSEYTVEYAVALLMNLCLRTAGKAKCLKNPDSILGVLVDLLEHQSTQVRTYVHGTLYSLLSQPSIRSAAASLGLEEILAAQIKVSDEQLRRQLDFILQQLNGGDADDVASDDFSDDGEEEDDEDEDSDDLTEADAAEGEPVTSTDGMEGEQLLLSRYSDDPPPAKPPTPIVAEKKSYEEQNAPLSRPATPRSTPSRTGSGTSRPSSGVARPNGKINGSRPGTGASSRPSSSALRLKDVRPKSGLSRGHSSSRPNTNAGSRPMTGDIERPRTSRGSRPNTSSRSRPQTGGRPRTSRSSLASAHEDRPRSRSRSVSPALNQERERDPEENSDSGDAAQPVVEISTDEAASHAVSALIGQEKKLAAVSGQPKPPSQKVLEKLEGKDVDLDEYALAFGSRNRVCHTP